MASSVNRWHHFCAAENGCCRCDAPSLCPRTDLGRVLEQEQSVVPSYCGSFRSVLPLLFSWF